MIPALEKKKENIQSIESYKISKPENVIVSTQEAENSKKYVKHNLIIEDPSIYETPNISDNDESRNFEMKQKTPIVQKVNYTKQISTEINIGDISLRDNSAKIGNSKLHFQENDVNLIPNENHNYLSNASNDETKYQKNIINSLDSICVSQYNINPNFPFDPYFFDILCINCYECVKYSEVDKHSKTCVIRPDEGF